MQSWKKKQEKEKSRIWNENNMMEDVNDRGGETINGGERRDSTLGQSKPQAMYLKDSACSPSAERQIVFKSNQKQYDRAEQAKPSDERLKQFTRKEAK